MTACALGSSGASEARKTKAGSREQIFDISPTVSPSSSKGVEVEKERLVVNSVEALRNGVPSPSNFHEADHMMVACSKNGDFRLTAVIFRSFRRRCITAAGVVNEVPFSVHPNKLTFGGEVNSFDAR